MCDDRTTLNQRTSILPELSGHFDPEAHPELKKPPDQSVISIGTKVILKVVISRNDLETATLDPERDFIDPKKNTGLLDD